MSGSATGVLVVIFHAMSTQLFDWQSQVHIVQYKCMPFALGKSLYHDLFSIKNALLAGIVYLALHGPQVDVSRIPHVIVTLVMSTLIVGLAGKGVDFVTALSKMWTIVAAAIMLLFIIGIHIGLEGSLHGRNAALVAMHIAAMLYGIAQRPQNPSHKAYRDTILVWNLLLHLSWYTEAIVPMWQLPHVLHLVLVGYKMVPAPPAWAFSRIPDFKEALALLEKDNFLSPEECSACCIEDACEGCELIATDEAERTFKVVSCKCSDPNQLCEFCQRYCVDCGGGELWRQKMQDFKFYASQLQVQRQIRAFFPLAFRIGALTLLCETVAGTNRFAVIVSAILSCTMLMYHLLFESPSDQDAVRSTAHEPVLQQVKKGV